MKSKFMLSASVVLITSMVLVGCNMFKGAGKDIENAGSSIQKTVNKND